MSSFSYSLRFCYSSHVCDLCSFLMLVHIAMIIEVLKGKKDDRYLEMEEEVVVAMEAKGGEGRWRDESFNWYLYLFLLI